MHLWCSKGIAPQTQGHERETCLSSFQHSLKHVFELCKCFQTASHQRNPQQLMGRTALALGQWGTRASRMGCGLAGRLMAGLTAPHRIYGGFLAQSLRATSLTLLCCQWTMLAVFKGPVATKARRLVDLSLTLKIGRAKRPSAHHLKAINDRFHYKELYYLVYGEFVKKCNNILFLK